MQTIANAFTRRRFLALLPPLFGGLIALACGSSNDGGDPAAASQPATATSGSSPLRRPRTRRRDRLPARRQQAALTPACGDDDDDPTVAQTEGPYFKASSPQRTSLIEGSVAATRLLVEGVVMNTTCRPWPGRWSTSGRLTTGASMTTSGFRFRGHQFTDEQGRYRLETVLPGLYPGRTRHIHVKVQAPNRAVLTTQLYFPTSRATSATASFNSKLMLEDYKDASGGKAGRFDFVVMA
jgi:protocatechuate 3,4-dioxygenase beta subunit